MKKFLKTLSIYGISIFVLLNIISFLCLYSLGKSSFYKQQFVKNGVTDTSFDYVILGSSTGLTTLDTKQIDSITRLKGLNISMDDSGLSAHYLMLEQFYSFGHQTDKLVLCITPNDVSNLKPIINGNDYRFLPDASDANVKQYFCEIEGKDKWIYQSTSYLPLVGVSYFNSELFFPGIVALVQPKRRNLFDDKGNYSYPVSKSALKLLDKKKTQKVAIKNPYFSKIVDFCKQHDIELIVYQSPIYNLNPIYNINLPLINHSSLFDDTALFYDEIHVNKKGRRVCSSNVATFLLNIDSQDIVN